MMGITLTRIDFWVCCVGSFELEIVFLDPFSKFLVFWDAGVNFILGLQREIYQYSQEIG